MNELMTRTSFVEINRNVLLHILIFNRINLLLWHCSKHKSRLVLRFNHLMRFNHLI